MSTVEHIELFWDCPECGQKHISAVFNPQGNRCPNCWHWRVDDITLYEAPDSQIITDRSVINHKPFWVCKVCSAVNEDTGLQAHLLQCGNCDSYQVSQVADITGNQATDQQAPSPVPVGEVVELQENQGDAQDRVEPRSPNRKLPWKSLAAGLTGLTLVGGGFLASSIQLEQPQNPAILQVQVTNLQWAAEVDVQEQKNVTNQSWRDAMPVGASIVSSETRQRGIRQEQRGTKNVMVEEQYQSGNRIETYYESERYQSGTRNETYYESERYQSETKDETYYESEQYQSGSQEKCKTTSKGNGVGRRTCSSVPVYGTRQVSRRRSVPVYSTRQIPRTRSVPVYSTRQVPRTRSVPVYSTRAVSKQEPIMVDIPVQDTWVTYRVSEWVAQQTHRQTGLNHAPPNVDVRLANLPPQRISATRMKCLLTGSFTTQKGWFETPKSTLGIWELPCQEYNQLQVGEQIKLRLKSPTSANLVKSTVKQ